MKPQLSTKWDFRGIAKQLLTFQPQERKTLRNLNEKYTASEKKNNGISKDLEENTFLLHMMLIIADRTSLDDFK